VCVCQALKRDYTPHDQEDDPAPLRRCLRVDRQRRSLAPRPAGGPRIPPGSRHLPPLSTVRAHRSPATPCPKVLPKTAQRPAKVSRIGVLTPGCPPPSPTLDTFLQGLRDLGYVDGQTVAIEWRYSEGKAERFPDLAAELACLQVDLIVAVSTPAALAAKQVTSTIPIARHNLARAGQFARVLEIPNPILFYNLAAEIVSSWPAIVAHISQSPVSSTTPRPTNSGARAIITHSSPSARARLRARYREDTWTNSLRRFTIRSNARVQIGDVLSCFSLAFELARQNPEKPVLRYAIARLQGVNLKESSWHTYQDLLYQCIASEPSTIQYALSEPGRYQRTGMKLNLDCAQATLSSVITKHVPLGQGREVAWAVWSAIALSVPISDHSASLLRWCSSCVFTKTGLRVYKLGHISRQKAAITPSPGDLRGLPPDSLSRCSAHRRD
jgi:hypothetical protein